LNGAFGTNNRFSWTSIQDGHASNVDGLVGLDAPAGATSELVTITRNDPRGEAFATTWEPWTNRPKTSDVSVGSGQTVTNTQSGSLHDCTTEPSVRSGLRSFRPPAKRRQRRGNDVSVASYLAGFVCVMPGGWPSETANLTTGDVLLYVVGWLTDNTQPALPTHCFQLIQAVCEIENRLGLVGLPTVESRSFTPRRYRTAQRRLLRT
jgi:hypothetical protein